MSFKVITLGVPPEWLKLLDEAIKAGLFPNRSEAIRTAIRDLLKYYGFWSVRKL